MTHNNNNNQHLFGTCSSDSESESSEDSDGSFVFTGGNKKRNFVPETQFEFNDQDLALAGNVDGIGNIEPICNCRNRKVSNLCHLFKDRGLLTFVQWYITFFVDSFSIQYLIHQFQ